MRYTFFRGKFPMGRALIRLFFGNKRKQTFDKCLPFCGEYGIMVLLWKGN